MWLQVPGVEPTVTKSSFFKIHPMHPTHTQESPTSAGQSPLSRKISCFLTLQLTLGMNLFEKHCISVATLLLVSMFWGNQNRSQSNISHSQPSICSYTLTYPNACNSFASPVLLSSFYTHMISFLYLLHNYHIRMLSVANNRKFNSKWLYQR